MSATKPIDRTNPHYQIGYLHGALIVARSALEDVLPAVSGRQKLRKEVAFAISLADRALVETKAPVTT